jgi:hypothetical protein
MPYFARDEEYEKGWPTAVERYFPDACPEETALVGKHVMAMYSASALERLALHDERLILVLVLRNPVDRAYSHFWYARQLGWETESTFESALARGEPTDHEAITRGSGLAYLTNGHYAPFVEQAIEALGEERTSIVLTSDLRASAVAIAQTYFERLGVERTFEPNTLVIHNRTVRARSTHAARIIYRMQRDGSPLRRTFGRIVPTSMAYRLRDAANRLNAGPAPIPDMDPSTRAQLIDHFAPGNDALSRLIGRDLASWNT